MKRLAETLVRLLFMLHFCEILILADLQAVPQFQQAASAGYPSAVGTVLSSQLQGMPGEKGRLVPHARIEYQYVVEDHLYHGDRVDYLSGAALHPKELFTKHSTGSTVPVFYRPNDPADSVLMPGFDSNLLLAVGPLTLFLVCLNGFAPVILRLLTKFHF